MRCALPNAQFLQWFEIFDSQPSRQFGLHPAPNRLNSSGVARVRASMADFPSLRNSLLNRTLSPDAIARGARLVDVLLRVMLFAFAMSLTFLAAEARAEKLSLPSGASAVLDKIYS